MNAAGMQEREVKTVVQAEDLCNDCAPIALFVYNRPQHARRTVETLRANGYAKNSDLFVFSDAPRDEGAARAVAEVRELMRDIDGFRSVTLVERERNLGLASSIIDGVTRLCEERGRVIVLEDDLLVSPYFLEYMNTALEHYREDERVMQISGHMFPIDVAVETDAVFLPMTTSWGWATWLRAWRHFDPTAKGYGALKHDAKLRRRFDLDGAYDYSGMLERQLRGEVDSWAVRWYLDVFMLGGLTLFPRKTLVANAGFDGSGTHLSRHQPVDNLTGGFKVARYPCVAIDEAARQAVYAFLASRRRGVRLFRRMQDWLFNRARTTDA